MLGWMLQGASWDRTPIVTCLSTQIEPAEIATAMQRTLSTLDAAALSALAALGLLPASADAAEGGTTYYLPGAVATMIDLAPTQP